MTRDEFVARVEVAVDGHWQIGAMMQLIDAYIEDERERIAQEIEAEAAKMTVVGAHGMERAAEIVLAEAVSGE